MRFATGLIFLELIVEKIFAPLQPRGTASVADLDMVRQRALEPTQPARPGHRTHLAHHFQRLHPLVRLSHVDRQPVSKAVDTRFFVQRRAVIYSGAQRTMRECAGRHAKVERRPSSYDCHMFYAACVPRGEHAERGWAM